MPAALFGAVSVRNQHSTLYVVGLVNGVALYDDRDVVGANAMAVDPVWPCWAPCNAPGTPTVEVEVSAPDPGNGLTGIREIDDVITALNPSRRQAPPILLSPDLPGQDDRMTIWTA